MTTIAVMMVRDEADILPYTLAHLVTQVDHVIVADNMSTDATPKILAGFEGVVTVINDEEPAYLQSRKTSALAHRAGVLGADWVVPVDADELIYSPFGRVADVLADLPVRWMIAGSRVYDHRCTSADPVVESPLERIGWRTVDPIPLQKIVARYRPDLTIEQGNHGASYDAEYAIKPGLLVTRHFPYRSAEQMIRKVRNGAAAYAAAGASLPESAGAHWRGYGRILDEKGPEGLTGVFEQWFYIEDPFKRPDMIYDPAPAAGQDA